MKILSSAFVALAILGRDKTMANAEWGLKGKLDVDPSDIPNWAPDYGFGTQVALSGSTAIVGSRKRDNNGLGSARVFVRESGGLGWDQQALLVGNDGDATHEYFGYAVALDGDTAVVTAVYYPDPQSFGLATAKAFVFLRTASGETTSWTQHQVLTLDDDTNAWDYVPVDLDGDTIVIGNVGTNEKVFVFVRTGNFWAQEAQLTANDGAAGDYFGDSVAISGDTIIVGAIQQNSPGMKGKAYIITRVGTTWTQMAILEPHAAAPDGVCFGSSVSVDNGVAVVGTNGGDHFGYTVTAGLAYVFTGSGATWTRDAVLENDPLADELCFGCAVAVKDGNVLVGVKDMYGETYNDGTAQFWGYGPQDGYPGGYLYALVGSTWAQQTRLYGGGKAGHFSDGSVALDGNSALITAHEGTWYNVDADPPGFRQGSVSFFDNFSILPMASWDIIYRSLTADFTVGSLDELVVKFSIGRSRQYETEIFAGDCTALPLEAVSGIVITTMDVRKPGDVEYDALRLAYDFDKSAITGSNIWNAATEQIQICHIVRLIESSTGTDSVIQEDKRALAIDFDFSAGFQIANGLGAGTIDAGAGSAGVSSYVEACKCDGTHDVVNGFNCDSSPLLPNVELYVCIWSNSPTNVLINSIESMAISQDPSASFPVIGNSQVLTPSISSITFYASSMYVVSTRVPSNIFDFTSGSTISVDGGLLMALARRQVRKLQLFDTANASDKNTEEKASFELEVNLQREMTAGNEILTDVIVSAGSNGIITTVHGMMIFAFAYYIIF